MIALLKFAEEVKAKRPGGSVRVSLILNSPSGNLFSFEVPKLYIYNPRGYR